MNLLLIGYRGTGKTSVARALAERTGGSWVDADDEVERMAGKSIRQIFDDDGERTFRDWETQVITRLAERTATIIALGGGAILRPENRQLIRRSGAVVWLTAAPETIDHRIHADPTTGARRPDLTATGGFDEIQQVLAERIPLYRESADWVVDTEGKTIDQIAGEILDWMHREHRTG